MKQQTAVVLVNLGTPDQPTAEAVRRYLAEFLWDPRVVELPRWLWWLILHGIVLNVRPKKSAHAYQQVWSERGSPLLAISQAQRAGLERELSQRGFPLLRVELAMRYGRPSLPGTLRQLRDEGYQRLLVLPLYPQYSATTTASTFDAVAREFNRWRAVPELRMVMDYHNDPDYLQALAASIREHWQNHGQAPLLLMSFHGIPKPYADAGDPYVERCRATASALAQRLALRPEQWRATFQSRFGMQEWVQPYTDATLKALPKEGIEEVDVVCPGFSADCLETLEEVALTNRALFLQAGGRNYRYIPALNDRADHLAALADIALRELSGWL